MRVAIYTLGCKVNQYETQAMEQELLRRGHTLVPAETEADGYIVNTCSVTAISDKKSRQMIRRCHKLNPNAVVAACGCYVQTHPEVVAALDVDLLAGTGDRMAFLDLFEQAVHEKEPVRLLDDALRRREFEVLPAGGMAERTRAMLKVEDGCVNFCTYCIVPYVRGREKSRKPGDILAEFRGLVEAGYKEITLLGQNVNSYGKGLEEKVDFSDLLNLLCTVPGDYQIRFMTSHPKDASHKLIDTIAAEEKVLPYLDIPIQHCNDRVLKAMNRRGDKAELLALFRKLRARIPDLVLRTSLITGLPFEDEAAFEELCEFLQEVRIERAGVFPYSPEEGTPAARMLNRVDTAEAERRAELVVDVQSRIMDDFNDSRMGTVAEVLCDGFDQEAMQFVGRSYAESPDIDGRIYFTADHEVEAGEFVPVRITGAMDGELTGELAE